MTEKKNFLMPVSLEIFPSALRSNDSSLKQIKLFFFFSRFVSFLEWPHFALMWRTSKSSSSFRSTRFCCVRSKSNWIEWNAEDSRQLTDESKIRSDQFRISVATNKQSFFLLVRHFALNRKNRLNDASIIFSLCYVNIILWCVFCQLRATSFHVGYCVCHSLDLSFSFSHSMLNRRFIQESRKMRLYFMRERNVKGKRLSSTPRSRNCRRKSKRRNIVSLFVAFNWNQRRTKDKRKLRDKKRLNRHRQVLIA